MKKMLSLVTAVILAFGAAACASPAEPAQSTISVDVEEPAATDGEEQPGTATGGEEGKLKVGIVQNVEHPALDSAREGFTTALADNGFADGEKITIDVKNGQNDPSNLKSISQKFVSDKCDLILAIATPSAQSVAAETKTIPIVVTAVTDPADAGLVVSNEDPQTNVTGTSDMAPYKEQVDLMMKLLPGTKNLAIMYNSSEPNSVLQAGLVEAYATEAYSLAVEHKTVTGTNDIAQVAEALVGKFDAVYLPTDNTMATAMPTLANVAVANKLPVICAEEGMVTQGGLASVSINYYELGYRAGEMAALILNGENVPQKMPIEYAPNPTLIFNAAMFDALGMEIPEDLKAGATIVNE